MTDDSTYSVTLASSFQAGQTCPACQRLIEENQRVVRCGQCGGVHHELCWQVQNGCSSYHCDKRTRVELGTTPAEIVIDPDAALQAYVPPPPQRASSEEAARPYMPEPPRRFSKLAFVAMGAAFISGLTVWGALLDNWQCTVIGFAAALAAMLIGVIALVAIQTGRRSKGLVYAAAAVAAASAVILASTAIFAFKGRATGRNGAALNLSDYLPDKDELAAMDPVKANTLRANVVIQARPAVRFSSAMLLSSGIVLKVADNKAFILTNRHAVTINDKPAKHIQVLFYNGERSPATIEWMAPAGMDIAVLSCQALTLTDVEPARLAEWLAPQGERVFAIGNPLNLCWTYSEGVVCAARSQPTPGGEISVYQTQAPIRLGSSGGGLYDMQGNLLGINTWTEDKFTREGLAFAISSRSILLALTEEKARQFLAPAPAEQPQEEPE